MSEVRIQNLRKCVIAICVIGEYREIESCQNYATVFPVPK